MRAPPYPPALLFPVLLACSSAGPTEAPDSAASIPVESCREALTCQLLGDSDCAASPEADAALECQRTACSAGDYACFGEQCAEAAACYFAGGPGQLGCAAVWQCFGNCGDDAACLNQCAAGATAPARGLFLAVEACSDAEVSGACEDITPACDQRVLAGPCREVFAACLADRPALPPELAKGCDCGPDPVSCTAVTGDAVAACPDQDVTALTARLTCLAGGCGECPSFSPSALCQEVVGERGGALP